MVSGVNGNAVELGIDNEDDKQNDVLTYFKCPFQPCKRFMHFQLISPV